MKQIMKRLKEEPASVEVPEVEIPTRVMDTQESLQLEIGMESQPVVEKQTGVTTPYDHLTYTHLTFTDETSHKFWEAATEETKLIVRFGRIGTKGQVQVKTFNTAEQAEKEKEKMVREKLAKGYVE
jgi:predicted DNA-binding WGR domain protein